jgi:cell shape-determining protein MreC
MASSFPTRRLVIGGLMVFMVVGALMPARYSGYASWFGDKLRLALAPLSHPVHFAAASLRRHLDPAPDDARTLLARWENAQETAAALIRLQEEVNRLRLENRMLRNIRGQLERRAESYRFPTAGVVGRAADPGSGLLTINRGTRDGLIDHLPAVDGANLVGRISRAERVTSSLQLITTPSTRLNVILTPKLAPLGQLLGGHAACQLDAVDGGRFVATVPVDTPVEVGHYARLVDVDWPQSVQGMIVGKVTKVEPRSDDPLYWKKVEVEPRLTLRYLTTVTLIVPQGGGE